VRSPVVVDGVRIMEMGKRPWLKSLTYSDEISVTINQSIEIGEISKSS